MSEANHKVFIISLELLSNSIKTLVSNISLKYLNLY